MRSLGRFPWRWPLPDTLVGRATLILLGGLLLSQLAALVLFSLNRLELAAKLDSRHIAERVAGVVQIVEGTPTYDRGRLIRSLDQMGFHLGWGRVPLITARQAGDNLSAIRTELARRLPDRAIRVLYRPKGGESLSAPPPPEGAPSLAPSLSKDADSGPDFGTGMGYSRPAANFIAIALSDGTWLNAALPIEANESLWRWQFVLPLAGGNLVVLLLSILAVRLGVKPLQLLSAAAERLGRDVGAPPLAVNGPQEVRAAAMAFNRMQIRLRRFIEDRTQMVAAISHDLRTPITRLKLRAEFVEDDEQRLKMLSDLDEMEAMIAATLAFARDDNTREPHQLLDIVPLLQDLCAQFGASFEGPNHLQILAGLTGMKRVFANLLENARKYAGGARLMVAAGPGRVTITIDDDGPGLPPDQLEQVFTAFYRVETSRNRETGGTGLGLTVARSVVRAHGGDVILSNRPAGGLRATVSLPV